MKLSHLTDENLDLATVKLVSTERELLTEILHHLREVEHRRLFSKFGMSSLFDYAIKRLGYSEDQAFRRISAMRLLKELPALETKIETGALTLTHLAKAQTLFRQEKKAGVNRSIEQKLSVLTKIENQSKRTAEKILEQESPLTNFNLELQSNSGLNSNLSSHSNPSFYSKAPLRLEQFGEVLQRKLKRILDLQAQKMPSANLEKVIDEMADLALEKWDPILKAERSVKRKQNARRSAERSQKTPTERSEKERVSVTQNDAVIPAPVKVKFSRYIPAAVRHFVFMRDRGQCQNCRSSRLVQVDHIIAFAKGGTNEPENLRLLCRACNQRRAIDVFGMKKMQSFLREPVACYRE